MILPRFSDPPCYLPASQSKIRSMAQPVEIPFSVVRNHPSVRHLNAAEAGAYQLLVSAALWDGVNLAEQNDASLALLSKAHGITWARAKKAVLRALAETMPILRAVFQNHTNMLEAFRQRCRDASAKGLLSRRRKKELRDRAVSFVQKTMADALLIQPNFHPGYNLQSSPIAAHKQAEKRNKVAPKGKTLAETKA